MDEGEETASPARRPATLTPRARIVRLARFRHRHEAELARGYLEDAGIPAALSVDDGGGAFGLPIVTGGGGSPTLHVRETDVARARKILNRTGLVDDGKETDE